MEEYRCGHPHPKRRNAVCDRKLLKLWDFHFKGEMEVFCDRCGRPSVIDHRTEFTAVDKPLVAV